MASPPDRIPEWLGMMLALWQRCVQDTLITGLCLVKQVSYAGRWIY